MTPVFTNINYILNTLYSLSEKEFAFNFSKNSEGDEPFLFSLKELIKSQIENYDSIFELAEGEINQTIAGYNPVIINSLFHYIKTQRARLYPNPEYLLKKIRQWNEESYTAYESKVIERTTAYFSNEKFIGLKHLDTFDDYVPSNLFNLNEFKHVTRTYHAFYCVEEKWEDYFDLVFFDQYLNFINEQTDKLAALFDKYIPRYDAGEFTNLATKPTPGANDDNENKDIYSKTLKRAKRNKFLVYSFVIITVIGLLAGFAENIKKIFSFGNPPEKTIVVLKDTLQPQKEIIKVINGVILDENRKPIKGVCVSFKGKEVCYDTTDSFGRFRIPGQKGTGISNEIIELKSHGYPDTSLILKIDYDSEIPVTDYEVVLKKKPGKTDQQLCEEGNSEACYRLANKIGKECGSYNGSAQTACIMQAEMWRAAGDDYKDVLEAKKKSGVNSKEYQETQARWLHQIELSKAMPDY